MCIRDSPSREKEAADLMKITAEDLYNFGVCDKIISESVGGAHTDPAQTADNISAVSYTHLDVYKRQQVW